MAISDDVRAQHQLVTEHFGISQLALVSGWSMGGQQTLEWAVRYPDAVQRAVSFAATTRNPDHCTIFCDLHTEVLRSDPAFNGGFYERSADVQLGLRRHAQAFALMGPTSAMYRAEVWRELGFTSRDGFVQGFLQAYFLPMDPNNLLCQAAKWRSADVSGSTGGDMDAALGRSPPPPPWSPLPATCSSRPKTSRPPNRRHRQDLRRRPPVGGGRPQAPPAPYPQGPGTVSA